MFTQGDIISTYTRAQAIEDGVQRDVSNDKGSDVYKVPVFITSALHEALSKGQGKKADTYSARLWDACWLASVGRELSPSIRQTRVKIGARNHTVRAECGPVDINDPRPAITLGLPAEGDF